MQVADKLIDVFRSRKPEDWRKLIGFSSQWGQLAEHVFARQASDHRSPRPHCVVIFEHPAHVPGAGLGGLRGWDATRCLALSKVVGFCLLTPDF